MNSLGVGGNEDFNFLQCCKLLVDATYDRSEVGKLLFANQSLTDLSLGDNTMAERTEIFKCLPPNLKCFQVKVNNFEDETEWEEVLKTNNSLRSLIVMVCFSFWTQFLRFNSNCFLKLCRVTTIKI